VILPLEKYAGMCFMRVVRTLAQRSYRSATAKKIHEMLTRKAVTAGARLERRIQFLPPLPNTSFEVGGGMNPRRSIPRCLSKNSAKVLRYLSLKDALC
jgi:hypothetical protein